VGAGISRGARLPKVASGLHVLWNNRKALDSAIPADNVSLHRETILIPSQSFGVATILNNWQLTPKGAALVIYHVKEIKHVRKSCKKTNTTRFEATTDNPRIHNVCTVLVDASGGLLLVQAATYRQCYLPVSLPLLVVL
jgi:hypothetical protein